MITLSLVTAASSLNYKYRFSLEWIIFQQICWKLLDVYFQDRKLKINIYHVVNLKEDFGLFSCLVPTALVTLVSNLKLRRNCKKQPVKMRLQLPKNFSLEPEETSSQPVLKLIIRLRKKSDDPHFTTWFQRWFVNREKSRDICLQNLSR